jgi:hypothetical protein
VYGTGTDGDRRGHGKQARISGVSSGSGVGAGSDVGEVSGAWCGVQGTKKAEAPRGQLGRKGEGEGWLKANDNHTAIKRDDLSPVHQPEESVLLIGGNVPMLVGSLQGGGVLDPVVCQKAHIYFGRGSVL